MEKIKILLSIFLGLVATFYDKYGIMILLVGLAIIFDVITGFIKAKITGTVSSSIGTKGMFKKLAFMVALFFGFFLDYAIPYFLQNGLNFDITFNLPFGLMICAYIVLNESISILENLDASGVTLPKFVTKMLKSAKDKLDYDENEDDE